MYFSPNTMHFPTYHHNEHVFIELINCDQSANNGNTIRDRQGKNEKTNCIIVFKAAMVMASHPKTGAQNKREKNTTHQSKARGSICLSLDFFNFCTVYTL